jgi:hypothetical protein
MARKPDNIIRAKRLAFEAEAKRQCLAINTSAKDPTSDEAQVMRELTIELDALVEEWPCWAY